MEDNPTIHRYKCENCGKDVEIQSVYEPLIKECFECLYDKGRINYER
jgi:transposase-like protein